MRIHPLKVGDFLLMKTYEEAMEDMKKLKEHNIETRFYCNFKGSYMALEITYLSEDKTTLIHKEAEDE